MKLGTKKIVIRSISLILALVGIGIACLFALGAVEYKQIEMEGVPTIPLNVQIILLSMLSVLNITNIILCSNIIKYKKILVALNIIQLLFGGIINIIGSIVILIFLFIKTTDVQEEKKIIQLPELERINANRRWIYLIIWLLIFLVFYSGLVPLKFLSIIPPIARVLLIYIAQIIILVLILRKDIKRDFIALKTNFKTYMKYIFPKLGIFLILYISICIPIVLIAGQISTNQSQINELPLALTAIMAIILAPFVEELMFRGMLRKVFKSDKIFIILSAFIFGMAHVMYVEQNLIMYIYIVPYALIGYFLARTYSKTNNIFTNIAIHCLWNTFSLLVNIAVRTIGT